MGQTNYTPAVSTEIAFLHSLSRRNLIDGDIISEAFGRYSPEELLDDEPALQDWQFAITYDHARQQLQVCIDTYEHKADTTFDYDAWEAAQMVFETPASRERYADLQRIARALLAGYTVRFSDGVSWNLKQWRAQA